MSAPLEVGVCQKKLGTHYFAFLIPKWFMPQIPSVNASNPTDARMVRRLKHNELRRTACRLPEQADVTSVIRMGY
jgi:hypothetical protein